MADSPSEVVVEGQVDKASTTPEKVELHYENEETKALARGWKPKESWQGPEEDWIDARTFNRNQSYFDKIASQNKKIAKLTQTLSAMQEHHKKVFEASYQKALRDLKSQKLEAVKEGNVEAVIAIDEQLEQVNDKFKTEAAKFDTTNTNVSPDFVEWIKDNNWYHENDVLHRYADKVGYDYVKKHPEASDMEVYEHVRERVEEKFPEEFGGTISVQTQPRTKQAPAVEGANRTPARAYKQKTALDDNEQRIMKQLIRSGVMTEQEYMADLAAVKGQ